MSSTGDQVPDINQTLTAAKDGHWELYEWPTVDNYIQNGTQNTAPLAPANGIGGCAVGLSENGNLLYLGTYGEASPGQEWELGTIAPVGSISKSLTALAAVTLAQTNGSNGDPYLALSDTVGAVLPTSNPLLTQLSLSSLLDHSSGVGGNTLQAAAAPDWVDSGVADCAVAGNPTGCPNISRLLASPSFAYNFYESTESVGNAGNGLYSNVGYSIAGAIIDQVTMSADGLSNDQFGYEKYVWDRLANWSGTLDRRRMLSPAQVHSWRVTNDDFLHYASGYPIDTWEGVGSIDGTNIEGWEGPSGGWAMSIGDLTRFSMLFGDDDFLPATQRNAMVSSRSNPLSATQRWYGHGVFTNVDLQGLATEGGIGAFDRWYHGGDIGSHSAYWAHWPSVIGNQYSVALICNNRQLDSLTALEPPALWLLGNALRIESDRPVLKTTLGNLLPARPDTRYEYNLDFSTARFSSPRHLFLTPGYIQPAKMTITSNSRGTRVNVDLRSEGTRSRNALLTGHYERSDQIFRTRQKDLTLSVGDTTITLADAQLQFGMPEKSDELAGLTIGGTIDVRDLKRQGVVSGNAEACAVARDLGASCRPCSDGAKACVALEMTDIRSN